MLERFTRQAREVVVDARAQARTLGHPLVGTEHLLLALLDPRAGSASTLLQEFGLTAGRVRADLLRILGTPGGFGDEEAAALREIGIDIDAVRAKVEESFGAGALEPEVREPGGQRWSPRAKKVLELSLREALRLKHGSIGTEHLLLGLIREGQGLAAQIMTEHRVDVTALRRAVEESLRPAA